MRASNQLTVAAVMLGSAWALSQPVNAQGVRSVDDTPTQDMAASPDTENKPIENKPIIVFGRAIEQIGIATSGSQGTVGYADFDNIPISRTGELVENVPGVIATQHSGSGKANQYFLRGFNLDHGTDFAGFVDGVPINMRSHGHGQGYLDFNFVIPETLERIDYRKGPYFADVGDFSAAGTVQFVTRDEIDPFAQIEVGAFSYLRGVAAGSTQLGNSTLLIAAEAQSYDGPWVLDENLERFAGLVKYSHLLNNGSLDIQLNGYDSRWTATDQIPLRAVENGTIGRFGFIDDDLGGSTTRIGGVANATVGNTKFNAFATYYDFELISNFTYFLGDPVNGDEFIQRDRRTIYGGTASHGFNLGSVGFTIGGDWRYDAIDRVGLYNSVDGVSINTVRQDEVEEFGFGLYGQAEMQLAPRLRAIASLRYDRIGYDVASDLTVNSGAGHDDLFGPKLALAWQPIDDLELYANYGRSFHSNDVRGASISVDSASGNATDPVRVISPADGAEVGARFERGRLTAALVGYYLELGSELVFVGDAGNTEPNDGSRRYGVEATLFWRPTDWLTIDADYAFTDARFVNVGADNHIPGAVPEVFSGGITLNPTPALSLTAKLRHFGSAPLIEDNNVRSDPTTLLNLGGYYDFGRLRIGAELFNLLDAKDSDITYFYESQLAGEAASSEDRHFHPVEPRQLRVNIRYRY
ncbi:TonB-dependent receptor [Parasphingorhabdus halotolerans]|uniref:TonB-dependent receptor n=1 Tax=Parasphingorhabdus halotolerans TaxID=2725558 RepID=A0A6H2DKN8_9SPHN|nr:TonB-dependent receptor [Parasphingorhabdus halotolerans]QJB68707.1 TonB-dependent receptor [Parasphingorhabdus halotolerans]